MFDLNIKYLECACYSSEHTLRFIYDQEENELYTEVHLNSYGFVKRLLIAIKYIFGYQSKYGSFDCFIMNPKDRKKLIKILEGI